MIYLIDDKKHRQEKDYKWTSQKLESYHEIIRPIYNLEQLKQNRNNVFKESDVILYHESFIDKSILSDEAAQKRKELTEYAHNMGKNLVYFSGGIDTRKLENNIAYIPDAILYQNLEFFLKGYKNNDLDLRYLLFGSDPKLEEKLIKKQLLLVNETKNQEAREVPENENLFLRPSEDFISNPISNTINETLWECSDESLNEFVSEKLDEKKYDNIFIPLCFGDTLSDFNGLRLAVRIRCTKTKNQLSNLYIYGFVPTQYLINHKYFDILKTKNVSLIGFSKSEIFKAASKKSIVFNKNELRLEISKIKLIPPKNYNDNHSIANEWSIYRWSKTMNVSDEIIESIERKIESNIYFKYLKTIYPISKSEVINQQKLQINYSGNPKVLYIDDKVEKGWGEIFAFLFDDKNEIYFDYLVEDYKTISQERLIDSAIKKIKDDNIDLVLLDFRLLPSDLSKVSTNEVSSVKLLKAIKDLNPGIQVVIFSATNKIWNLQKLLEYRADGFILKESPPNSIDVDFTRSSIENMIQVINNCFERKFLKDFYNKIDELKTELLTRKNFKKASNPLDVNFVDEVLKWLQLSCELLAKNSNTASKTSAFLLLFSVLENLSNQIVSSEPIRIDNSSDSYFVFEFSRINNRLVFFNENKETGLYSKTDNNLRTVKRGIPWAQKILNTLDYLNAKIESEFDLNEIIGKRNDIIHVNSSLKGKLEISNKDLINLFNTVYNGLKMI
jgi:CheY-like chemotaxis protein